MSDLWTAIERDLNRLDSAIDELKELGAEKDAAERDYQSAKAKKALEMKADRNPVTLIEMVIKGAVEVTKLLYARMRAQTMYDCCREEIMTIKLRLKIENDQLAREWEQAGTRNR